jgi:hypothetical protein
MISSKNFVWNISHSKKNWSRYYNKFTQIFMWSTSYLSDFNKIWIFNTDFRRILKYQISWKFVPWKTSCSMRTDRQTARRTNGQTLTKQIGNFRNFVNAPNEVHIFVLLTDVVSSSEKLSKKCARIGGNTRCEFIVWQIVSPVATLMLNTPQIHTRAHTHTHISPKWKTTFTANQNNAGSISSSCTQRRYQSTKLRLAWRFASQSFWTTFALYGCSMYCRIVCFITVQTGTCFMKTIKISVYCNPHPLHGRQFTDALIKPPDVLTTSGQISKTQGCWLKVTTHGFQTIQCPYI